MFHKRVLPRLPALLLLLTYVSPARADEPGVQKYASMILAEPGLAAYWPLGGDLRDVLGRALGNAGEPGVRFVHGPENGNAVLLEKGGFVTMGPCPHLELPQAIELIFQLTAPPTGKYDPTLIAKRTGHQETRFSFHVIKDLKRLALWNGSQVVYFNPPGGPLAVGQWHHLASTWKAGDLRLYLDGIRCEGGTADFNVQCRELPLQIGSSSPTGAHPCDCAVAQVAVYDRVLPEAAIVRHVEGLSWGRERRAALARHQQEVARRREDERKQQEAAEAALRARQAEALARRLADPRPLERGQTRVYRGEHLTAISLPVGGIAAGPIQINGEARRHIWQIFRIDQMLGQWWALQVNLGWLYPPEHVQSAMASLFRYNFLTDFRGFKQAPRTFCEDGDAGLIQGTWPRGGRPRPPHSILYTEEVMSGFEYTAACLMIQTGLLREGFAVLCSAADRYDGRLRRLPGPQENASWGYSGNPFGDDECGKFYARAMSSWGVLIAWPVSEARGNRETRGPRV
jgi:hypothetical protein